MAAADSTRAQVTAAPDDVLARLRTLIERIVPDNAFQTGRLRAAGVTGPPASIEEFVERVPLTVKADLVADQHAHPPHGTNLTFPAARYVRLHQTSGTTGEPMRWLDTAESWDWMIRGWERVLRAAGVTEHDTVFLAFSFGPFIGLWMGFEAAERIGCLTIPGGAMNSVTRLRAIAANRATVLCCTPTYAMRLGEVAASEGVDLRDSSVRAIVVGGEPGASVPATRARLESLWPSARIFDHYGMTEVGPVTYQCPERPDHVHVLDDEYLCEVVDPGTGASLDTREPVTGELVLTPLGRIGSPVLRYRTGDIVHAVPPAPCACGRTTLTFSGGIVGRTDDMVCVRGVNIYPSAIEDIVRRRPDVAEYRVEIDDRAALAEIRVLVEPAGPQPDVGDGGTLSRDLEKAFRDAYNMRIPVAIVERGSLPRFELKARRWVRT